MSNDRAKCNTIFVNLLRFHGQQDTLSTAFLREFFETVRCDRVFNMSIHRDEYAQKLTKPRLDRISSIVLYLYSGFLCVSLHSHKNQKARVNVQYKKIENLKK